MGTIRTNMGINKEMKRNNGINEPQKFSGVLVLLWWALGGLMVGKQWANSGRGVGKSSIDAIK